MPTKEQCLRDIEKISTCIKFDIFFCISGLLGFSIVYYEYIYNFKTEADILILLINFVAIILNWHNAIEDLKVRKMLKSFLDEYHNKGN